MKATCRVWTLSVACIHILISALPVAYPPNTWLTITALYGGNFNCTTLNTQQPVAILYGFEPTYPEAMPKHIGAANTGKLPTKIR